jgi:hypothetical protein
VKYKAAVGESVCIFVKMAEEDVMLFKLALENSIHEG